MAGQFTRAITDTDFQTQVLAAPGLKLVDFWAEWCGPCRAIAPSLEAIGQELQGKAEILKMDVDANPETPARFHVRGIPTLIVFKDGKAVDQIVGALPKDAILETLKRHL